MKHILITGGAGFLGSHLAAYAINRGHKVTIFDDFSTGSRGNIIDLLANSRCALRYGDVRGEAVLGIRGNIDVIFNLASPASPPVYSAERLRCLTTNSLGVHNVTELAYRTGARLVQASTSEVYGDPEEHPQRETYLGNVNPVGERSCYDEGKRYAEAYLAAANREQDMNTGIIRIFNTYGPNMSHHDGRVISGFIYQALTGQPLTVYGDGTQTRSFCYVDDLVRAIWAMSETDHPGPINIGNPDEYTINELAQTVLNLTVSSSPISYHPLPADDPTRRKPDITQAQRHLGWSPTTSLEDGLSQTINWHKDKMQQGGHLLLP